MLHEETRAQWESYTPQVFIDSVLHGTLQNKLKLTSTVIHVYTQLMFHIPETETAMLTASLPGDLPAASLRDMFITMRWNAEEMLDVMDSGSVTLPSRYTPAMYMISLVRGVKGYVMNIHQCATALHNDPAVLSLGRLLPNERSARDVAEEILDHTTEIMRLLSFVQSYVVKLKSCV